MEVSGRIQPEDDETTIGVLCDICLLLNKNEKGKHYCTECDEFLCDNCCSVHKVSKLTRGHMILDGDEMPDQKLSSIKEKFCSKHSGKALEYYCNGHDDFFCSVCVTIEHKDCAVQYIDDIAFEFDKSTEYKSLVDTISSLIQRLVDIKETSTRNLQDSKNSHGQFVLDVKEARLEMNKVLDALESTILKEADRVEECHAKSAESTKTSCDTVLADLRVTSENMDEQIKYKQHRQLAMSAKEAQVRVAQYEMKVAELSTQDTMKYKFLPNEELLRSLPSFKEFGFIVKYQDDLEAVTVAKPRQGEKLKWTKQARSPSTDKDGATKPDNSLGNDDSVLLSIKSKRGKPKQKPRSQKPTVSTNDDIVPEDSALYKDVSTILSELTPRTFRSLVPQMQALQIDTEAKLIGVVDLIYEKATSDGADCVCFANLCRCLSMLKVRSLTEPEKFVNFRAVLLSKCQKEFKEGSIDVFAVEKKEIAEEAKDTKKERLLQEVEYKENGFRKRYLGNIILLGELFKLNMLTENIIHDCIFKLMKKGYVNRDFRLEAACKLMTSVGKSLDHEKAKGRMDQYFDQIRKLTEDITISTAVQLMLQDLIELRQNKWVP